MSDLFNGIALATEHAPDVPCRICGTRPAPGAERDLWGWRCSHCLQADLFGAVPSDRQEELTEGGSCHGS